MRWSRSLASPVRRPRPHPSGALYINAAKLLRFREEGIAGHPGRLSYENHVQRRHGTPRSEPQFCVQGRKGGPCQGRQGHRPYPSAPARPQIEGQADFPLRGSELQRPQMVLWATLLCLRAPGPWHGHGQRHRGQQWGTPRACCEGHWPAAQAAAEVQSGKPTAKYC